ncbi:MAG: hypothetical protein ABGX16_19275 [Pirellulales bacterium]
MWRPLIVYVSLFWLMSVSATHAATPYMASHNTQVPFCYVHGGARSWPFISGTLPKGSRVDFAAKRDEKYIASGQIVSGQSLSFSGITVRLTPVDHLEIISLASEPAISFLLEVTLTLPDGNTETQQLAVRPAPPDRPISYLADFGDDIIRIFMDLRDGHWRPIEKSAFDQYFRRCQAHGVSRLILWQSPFPYICDPDNYRPEEWDRYEKQSQAMLESHHLETLVNQLKQRGIADSQWGLHVPWGWVRQLCSLRLQRNLGPMITQSAVEHGISLTASFRPFETALTKYYEIPTFDRDGQFLWGFLPLATPIVNYRPEESCFAHYRTILKEMGHEASGRIHTLEFPNVANADAFRKRHQESPDNLQIVAAKFPPIQESSLILQRQGDQKYLMRPFGEIKTQAEATRLVLKDYQICVDGSTIRITGLDVPGDYRYLVLSNPADVDEAIDISALDPVRLWAKDGNRLGRENVFWVLDESLDKEGKTKSAGIPATGRDHTEFHATEAGRNILQNGAARLPLKGHQLVIDLGAPWSVEMMDLHRPEMRNNVIKEMATLLKLPAFDELFINTRSHVSLSAYQGDGEDGIRPLAHYLKAGKKVISWLGIDRAYAPIRTSSDSVLQALAADPQTAEKITTHQAGEWEERCQKEDSPYRWRYARNREVASGVRLFLDELDHAFPKVRTRIVLPLTEKSVIAVKDGLETIPGPNGKPYHRNYSRVWSTINHIRSIGEGMAMVQLDGLATEPVLFGVRGLPDSAPLQLYLDHSFDELATNRGSSFRGPRSFFFEAQESLRAKDVDAARLRREAIVCQLLNQRQEIGEVIFYEAADWLYYLPLSNPDVAGYGFLDRSITRDGKNDSDE